jgi:type I restriction enzyme R subunit
MERLSAIYQVVRKAYTRTVMVDRAFQAKTNHLVQQQVGSYGVGGLGEILAIDGNTIELIKNKGGGDGTKVINLIKSIEKLARNTAMTPASSPWRSGRGRCRRVSSSARPARPRPWPNCCVKWKAMKTRKKEQAEKSFDGLTYFVYRSLLDAKIENAEVVSRKIRHAFTEFPNWKRSENALRELRKKVTFAIFAETDDLDRVTAMVDALFTLLEKADRI